MLVVLGSIRRPKVRALRKVLRELRKDLGPAEVQMIDVPSGVRETPMSRAEIMAGARNRVDEARRRSPKATYWVGLEGGVDSRGPDGDAWLENWACVANERNTYFGSGGSIPLPRSIVREVVGRGRSLADVIDELSGEDDVRSGEGTWGILTAGRLTREEVFCRALLNAFAPFYSRLIPF